MMGQIYLDLTNQFNEGRLRAILSSGQAVVVHGLAFASKDGDWILREDDEALSWILDVLEQRGASYRYGAPLDTRWMRGGWSAHFEFNHHGERIRCDFVTRPPRLAPDDLAQMWLEIEAGQGVQDPVPTLDLRRLAHLKATQRERDYAFIGEIARKLESVRDQLLWSRSARDLIQLAAEFPDEIEAVKAQRPLLGQTSKGRHALQMALAEELYQLTVADEKRLVAYDEATRQWSAVWARNRAQITRLPLREAHRISVELANESLPQQVKIPHV